MDKKCKLLNEYENIICELANIHNQINIIKDITENKIKCATSEEDKSNIFVNFKSQIDCIKNDKNIKQKYKYLQKRKIDIKNILLSEIEITDNNYETENLNSVDDDLNMMINKYKKNINKTILYPKKEYHQDLSSEQEITKKYKKNNKDDIIQMNKLYNLIESLKLEIDK